MTDPTTASPGERTCGSCAFRHKDGRCFANPPTLIAFETDIGTPDWWSDRPLVDDCDMACRHYLERPDAE